MSFRPPHRSAGGAGLRPHQPHAAAGPGPAPQLHSSSSIFDNDDETEAEFRAMFGEAGEEGIWEEGGEPFEDASRRDGPERAMFGEPDEYGFVDPMSPSPVANARFPRSGVLGSTAHGSGWTSTNHTSPSMSTAAGRQLAPKPSQSTLAPSRSSYSAYPHAPTGVPPDAMSRTMIPSGVRGREGGGIIRPMPVRPATGAPARNNLSTAPVGAPQMKLQQKLHHSRTQHNQPTTAQREDEEQYWQDDPLAGESGLGAGDMLDAWDDAFASVDVSSKEARRDQQMRAGATSTSRSRQENAVQYPEDLDAIGGEPRSGRRAAEPTGGTMRRQDVRLKPVSSLPDMFRSLWRFGVFNAVQSICFDSVHGSDEHVVVSAPTGAGKTILFELAVLRVLTNPASSESKVLYMAPTKSLCSERVADWKKKFEHGFGWTVQELTGDSDISNGAWRDVAKARIIVTTPEKWDAMTRKWHDHCTTLGQLRLFCIDEVHSVGSDRGAVLEVVVSRMKTLGTNTRFVAVSATVPNIVDVAEWLGSSSNGGKQARVFQFDDDFRPCKLQKVVVGYPRGSNDFAFAASLSFKLYDLIKQYSSGKPVLVFCNTRKGCTQAAEALLKAYKEAIDSKGPRAALAWPKPRRVDFKTSDRALAVLLEAGLAVHHAGMEINDRKLVERLFTDGGISVVCSTSTLAVGVNLPARMVIIKGTKGFVDGQMRDYTDLDILQMIGRAGRPQFDTLGIAVIMTEKGSEAKYSQLVNAQTRLESCLHNSLTEHVNSEIALGTIGNVPSALRWLRSTFLFVRIHKNRAYYGLDVDGTSPEQRLEEFCLAAIEQLVQSGLVERDGEDLAANHFSDIMSKFYISYQTFLAIKTLPVKSSMRSLLSVIAQSSELSSYRFRQGEKSVFTKLNKDLKFPAEKVATTADRIMILIQLVLDGVPGSELKTESTNPMLDARAIFIAATRIAKCMVDVAVEREDGAIRTMLELLRSLNGRCWDNSSLVLRQLEGIGEKGHKALAAAGIKSFADVRVSEADRLQMILSRKPPFGHKLISQATSIPQFEMEVESVKETTVPGQGVQVDVCLDLRLKQTKPLPVTKRGGLKLFATVATTTTDSEFVDFRRARLEQILAKPKTLELSVILVKPSQRIIVSMSCDSIAGSEVRLAIKPDSSPRSFPLPSLGSGDGELGENYAEEEVVAQEGTPSGNDIITSLPNQDSAPVAARARPQKEQTRLPRRRDNGRFECNHSCGDKTKCKHLCCREGLENPPAQRTRSTKAARATGNAPPGNLDPAHAPREANRIKPLESSGVKLRLDASGKATACEVDSDVDELGTESDDSSPSTVPTSIVQDVGQVIRAHKSLRRSGAAAKGGPTVDTRIFASPSSSPSSSAANDRPNPTARRSFQPLRPALDQTRNKRSFNASAGDDGGRQEGRAAPPRKPRLSLERASIAPATAAEDDGYIRSSPLALPHRQMGGSPRPPRTPAPEPFLPAVHHGVSDAHGGNRRGRDALNDGADMVSEARFEDLITAAQLAAPEGVDLSASPSSPRVSEEHDDFDAWLDASVIIT